MVNYLLLKHPDVSLDLFSLIVVAINHLEFVHKFLLSLFLSFGPRSNEGIICEGIRISIHSRPSPEVVERTPASLVRRSIKVVVFSDEELRALLVKFNQFILSEPVFSLRALSDEI